MPETSRPPVRLERIERARTPRLVSLGPTPIPLDLAVRALDDPSALAVLLRAWRLSPGVLARLVSPLDVPDSEDTSRLVNWAGAVGDTRRGRLAAALCLLSRLGEELHAREREAPRARRWPAGPRDRQAHAAWRGLFRDGLRSEPDRVAKWWGGIVSGAFAGVARTLGLPRAVGQQLGAAAREQLDLVIAGAHLDVAARVIETRGEPIAALTDALGPVGWTRIHAAVRRRAGWGRVVDTLRVEGEPSPAQVVDAVVLHRLAENLRRGRAPPHAAGPPAWGVVVANRVRMRGRMRAVATLDPERLAEQLLALDALHARTAAMVARFAWEWAWREARTGFGFDPDRLRPPTCAFVEERAPTLRATERSRVRTFLLLVAGRGAWDDLLRWVRGDAGRSLGRTFYRCLETAALADDRAPGGRHERLRSWLALGGLEACLPELRAAARAALAVPGGPGLPERLGAALAPWWDPAVPPPRHHLPAFRAGLAALLI